MIRRASATLGIFLSPLLFSSSSLAQSAVGPILLVNTYTTDSQEASSVQADAIGNFVVVWQSNGSTGTDIDAYSIQGQRYDSSGSPVGGEFQVNSYTTGNQYRPSVAVAPDGDFVVVWNSEGSDGGDGSGGSVQGQRFAADGSEIGSQFQVNSYTTDNQYLAAVAASPSGDFVVVWASAGGSSDDLGSSIQGQRYASDGIVQGDQFQVNSYTPSYQQTPAVAMDSMGGFVVVWHSFGSTGTDDGYTSIQGQRYASDGSPLSTEFQVNSYTTNYQFSADVGIDAAGDFVVVWESFGSYGTDVDLVSVQGQRYASSGSSLGGQFQVNSYTTSLQYKAEVELWAGGNFVVVWHSNGAFNGYSMRSVQGRCYSGEGVPLTPELQVSSYTFEHTPSGCDYVDQR